MFFFSLSQSIRLSCFLSFGLSVNEWMELLCLCARRGIFITFDITKWNVNFDRISDFVCRIENNNHGKMCFEWKWTKQSTVCLRLCAYANHAMTHIQIVIWLMISLGIVCWKQKTPNYLHNWVRTFCTVHVFENKNIGSIVSWIENETKISGVNFAVWLKDQLVWNVWEPNKKTLI